MATSSSSSSHCNGGAHSNGAQSNDVEHTDALVVGGGPIGLLIAAQLVRFGCSATVIERDDKPSMPIYGRATTLWCRTLELLDQLGLCDPLMEEGCFTKDGVNFRNGKAVPGGCVGVVVPVGQCSKRASTLMPSIAVLASVQTDLWAGEQVSKKRASAAAATSCRFARMLARAGPAETPAPFLLHSAWTSTATRASTSRAYPPATAVLSFA